jgi:hypothetical protein
VSISEPIAEAMVETDCESVLSWVDIRARIINREALGWQMLVTVRPDGRPHVVPVWSVWSGDALFVTMGQGTRKGKNLAHNPHCVLAFGFDALQVVVEGNGERITDDASLQDVAEVYKAQGWPVTVADGAFAAPFGAPTTGPAPYDVFKVTPKVVFGFPGEEGSAHCPTRWRF